MSTSQVTPGPVPVEEIPQKKEKAKPTRTLPSERITTAKQLDILRAYAAASGNGTKAATINEVAEIVKMAPTTVSVANAFLSSIGLLQRAEAGSYMPSPEAISFLRAYEWNPDTASHKLGPPMRETWFAQALLPRISFGPMEEEAAISVLADACSAAPEYRKELRMLVEFLAASGLVQRENGQIRIAKQSPAPETPNIKPEEPHQENKETPSVNASRVNTSFQQPNAGGFNLNISIEVDMAEFSTWRPERIQAFFRGVAEVLAAKADVEKGGTQT